MIAATDSAQCNFKKWIHHGFTSRDSVQLAMAAA
jgi:hypothetical protein